MKIYERLGSTEETVRRRSITSLSSKDAHTTAWAILSRSSMNAISHASVISLAITVGQVYNLTWYIPQQQIVATETYQSMFQNFGSHAVERKTGVLVRTKCVKHERDTLIRPSILLRFHSKLSLLDKSLAVILSLRVSELQGLMYVALLIKFWIVLIERESCLRSMGYTYN